MNFIIETTTTCIFLQSLLCFERVKPYFHWICISVRHCQRVYNFCDGLDFYGLCYWDWASVSFVILHFSKLFLGSTPRLHADWDQVKLKRICAHQKLTFKSPSSSRERCSPELDHGQWWHLPYITKIMYINFEMSQLWHWCPGRFWKWYFCFVFWVKVSFDSLLFVSIDFDTHLHMQLMMYWWGLYCWRSSVCPQRPFTTL